VSGKSHGNETISGFPYPEEVELAPSWVAGVVRDGKDRKNGPNGGVWMYASWRPGRQNGNPSQYLDDNFSELKYRPDGSTVSEIIDPEAKYGLRLVTLSPQIKSIQVYAPQQKNFVALEPQFNLPDPYHKNWG
jgi:galactose mutarotase-like enzyme